MEIETWKIYMKIKNDIKIKITDINKEIKEKAKKTKQNASQKS